MKILKVHRRVIGDMTIIIEECPTIWITSSTMRSNTTIVRRCKEHHKKREYKTIDKLAAHIIGNEVGVYEYVNSFGATMRVRCTYKEYLYLKMCYGVNGLTELEYKLYKTL